MEKYNTGFCSTLRTVCAVCAGRTIRFSKNVNMTKMFVNYSPLIVVLKNLSFNTRQMSEVSGGQRINLKICVQKFEYVAAKEHSQGS
jgi:hypothetical protein